MGVLFTAYLKKGEEERKRSIKKKEGEKEKTDPDSWGGGG